MFLNSTGIQVVISSQLRHSMTFAALQDFRKDLSVVSCLSPLSVKVPHVSESERGE